MSHEGERQRFVATYGAIGHDPGLCSPDRCPGPMGCWCYSCESDDHSGQLQPFTLPTWAVSQPGERPSKCRSCGARILWVIATKSGKPAPIDRDGVSHFATCPQASSWRKAKPKALRP